MAPDKPREFISDISFFTFFFTTTPDFPVLQAGLNFSPQLKLSMQSIVDILPPISLIFFSEAVRKISTPLA